MNLYTVRSFAKAIKLGSKYVYQTVPRLLTIWLDLGDDRAIAGTDVFKSLNETVSTAIADCPAYKVSFSVLMVNNPHFLQSGTRRSLKLFLVWDTPTLKCTNICPS